MRSIHMDMRSRMRIAPERIQFGPLHIKTQADRTSSDLRTATVIGPPLESSMVFLMHWRLSSVKPALESALRSR